jgi:hypothetical protein
MAIREARPRNSIVGRKSESLAAQRDDNSKKYWKEEKSLNFILHYQNIRRSEFIHLVIRNHASVVRQRR